MVSKYQTQINNALRIDLGSLSDYTDISEFFKQHDIQEYVYCFTYNDIIIKYGYSTGQIGSMWGERVYRQAGHLEGWSTRLNGSSGEDMRTNSNLFAKTHGYQLNRHGMVLYVIDMNRGNIAHRDPFTPTYVYCKELERELIDSCVEFHGKAPIGNRDGATKWAVRREKTSRMFKKHFVVEE